MSLSRLIPLTIFAAALTACNGDTPEEGQAAGQVLEGTISDQMLPVDQVRSEAPLADPTTARRASTGGAEDTAEAPAQEDPEPAEEAPAAPPEAEEE